MIRGIRLGHLKLAALPPAFAPFSGQNEASIFVQPLNTLMIDCTELIADQDRQPGTAKPGPTDSQLLQPI